jgi:hypothetical protein
MFLSDEGRCSALPPGSAIRLIAALSWLKQGYDYANDLGLDGWSFAVEIHVLRAEGLTDNDLRWLVCKGLVEHAGEVTALGDDARSFRETGRLRFCRKTCFVLTEAGAALDLAVRDLDDSTAPSPAPPVALAVDTGAGARPRWDADRQELRLGGLVVKQYKVPAPNQEMILAAFEEEGWPHRIDDPIPPVYDSEPKRRLHDTINSLNRSQKQPLLRFLGDGSGQGVRWEPTSSLRPHAAGNGNGNGNGAARPIANGAIVGAILAKGR